MHDPTTPLRLPARRPTERIQALPDADTEIADRLLANRLMASLFGIARDPLVIGSYRVIEPLGAGGMGVVYRAHDPELDRSVALKLMHPDLTGAADRLRSEARALGRLAHPNVVTVHEIGEHEGRLYVAMELVEGRTLRALLAESGPATPRTLKTTLERFLQAARGLAAAHAAGLVHCDFKPENVLVGADGRVRVADFGIASPIGVIASELTATAELGGSTSIGGELIGTPAYMAPEQFRRQPLDARVDQFAFCVALYEAITGQRPFAADTVLALIDAVLTGAPRPLPRWVPRGLRRLIARGLARDPGDRFADMDALVRDLESLLRPRVRSSLVGIGLGAVAAVGALALTLRNQPEPPGGAVAVALDEVPTLCVRPTPTFDDAEAYRAELVRRHRTLEDTTAGSRQHFAARAQIAALELEREASPRACQSTERMLDEEPPARVATELECVLERRCQPVAGVVCPEGMTLRGVAGCQPESLACAAQGSTAADACIAGGAACCLAAYARAEYERQQLGGVASAGVIADLRRVSEAGCNQGFAALCLEQAEVGLDPTEADRRACAFGHRAACERAVAR